MTKLSHLIQPDTEQRDYTALRSMAQGRLWMQVLYESLKGLSREGAFLAMHFPVADFWVRQPIDHDFAKRLNMTMAEIKSCKKFFFSRKSNLQLICDLLGFEIGPIRKKAREIMRECQMDKRTWIVRRVLAVAPRYETPRYQRKKRMAQQQKRLVRMQQGTASVLCAVASPQASGG